MLARWQEQRTEGRPQDHDRGRDPLGVDKQAGTPGHAQGHLSRRERRRRREGSGEEKVARYVHMSMDAKVTRLGEICPTADYFLWTVT
jgi:hypothetical protein